MNQFDHQPPRIPNYHQPRSHYWYSRQIDSNYHPMLNNLLQQQQSETMMFHPRHYYDQSFYYARSVNGFANSFHAIGPFPDNNRRHMNQVHSRVVGSGTNRGSRESIRRGRRPVVLALNVSIQDETAILDDVRLSVEGEGTSMLNELGLGSRGRDNNGNVEEGLLAETIWHHLSTRFYQKSPSSCDENFRFCAVCQSECENDEKLGLLECGHEYHAECIHRWLLEKNICPVCKRRGISQLEKL